MKELTAPNLATARFGVFVSFLVNGFAFASWVSRIPGVRHRLDLTDAQLGFALFGLAIGALIGFPLAGVLCGRFASRYVTTGFGLGTCAVLASIPYASNLGQLTLVVGFFGLTIGAMDVSMNANGVEVETLYGRSIMSSLHGMYSLGGLSGSLTGLILVKAGVEIVAHLSVIAIILAIACVVSCRMMIGSKPLHNEDHPIFAIPSKPLVAIGIIVACSYLCEGAMGDWSGVYLRDSLHTTDAFAVSGFVIYSLMMTLARFTGDRFLTRWGPTRVLRIAGSVAAVGFGLALLVGNPLISLLGFACVAVGMSTVAPIGFSAAGKSKAMRPGAAIAAVSMMGFSGFLVGPPFIGLLAQATSLRLALSLIALLATLIVILAPNAE